MLTGTTSVYIDTVKSDEENAVVAEEMSEKDIIEKMLEETGKKKKLDRKKYGKFILHYGKRRCFCLLELEIRGIQKLILKNSLTFIYKTKFLR